MGPYERRQWRYTLVVLAGELHSMNEYCHPQRSDTSIVVCFRQTSRQCRYNCSRHRCNVCFYRHCCTGLLQSEKQVKKFMLMIGYALLI